MRLTIAAIGKTPRGPERDLFEKLRDRADALAKATRLGPIELREIELKKPPRSEDALKQAEAEQLRLATGNCDRVVALDERGKTMGSLEFAGKLTAWRDEGARCTGFLIGGADGLDPALRKNADLVLCFGALTWPHALARAMLAEQLYRAATIAAGHPYHREG